MKRRWGCPSCSWETLIGYARYPSVDICIVIFRNWKLRPWDFGNLRTWESWKKERNDVKSGSEVGKKILGKGKLKASRKFQTYKYSILKFSNIQIFKSCNFRPRKFGLNVPSFDLTKSMNIQISDLFNFLTVIFSIPQMFEFSTSQIFESLISRRLDFLNWFKSSLFQIF